MHEEQVQVGVFTQRPSSPAQTATPIEMSGGEGNLVKLFGVHYSVETINIDANSTVLIAMGISSNPEHEGAAPTFDEHRADRAIYGRMTVIHRHDGIGDSDGTWWTHDIPLYGIVRPRRQLFVTAVINGNLATGMTAEVYYTPFGAPFTEREEVNRKYGKYRRS